MSSNELTALSSFLSGRDAVTLLELIHSIHAQHFESSLFTLPNSLTRLSLRQRGSGAPLISLLESLSVTNMLLLFTVWRIALLSVLSLAGMP